MSGVSTPSLAAPRRTPSAGPRETRAERRVRSADERALDAAPQALARARFAADPALWIGALLVAAPAAALALARLAPEAPPAEVARLALPTLVALGWAALAALAVALFALAGGLILATAPRLLRPVVDAAAGLPVFLLAAAVVALAPASPPILAGLAALVVAALLWPAPARVVADRIAAVSASGHALHARLSGVGPIGRFFGHVAPALVGPVVRSALDAAPAAFAALVGLGLVGLVDSASSPGSALARHVPDRLVALAIVLAPLLGLALVARAARRAAGADA